jgi:hypothetical protein
MARKKAEPTMPCTAVVGWFSSRNNQVEGSQTMVARLSMQLSVEFVRQ